MTREIQVAGLPTSVATANMRGNADPATVPNCLWGGRAPLVASRAAVGQPTRSGRANADAPPARRHAFLAPRYSRGSRYGESNRRPTSSEVDRVLSGPCGGSCGLDLGRES